MLLHHRILGEDRMTVLYFHLCGHITERMIDLIAGKIEDGDKKNKSDGILSPIAKMDAFGIKNLSLDVKALENFADGTGLSSLHTCFHQLRWLVDALLDPELPTLMSPENENMRRRKHPFLPLELIANVLEKYQGSGGLGGKFLGASSSSEKFLILEKKEVTQLLKIFKGEIRRG